MKLLALHGKQQNAEVFRTRCHKLITRAQRDKIIDTVYYHDGLHLLPLKAGDEVAMRAWYLRTSDGNINQASLEATLQDIDVIWRERGPFDGIFGFSMGGAMATIIASMPARFPGLHFVVVSGAPDLDTRSISNTFAIPANVCSLHMIGLDDRTVLPRSSHALAKRFCSPREVEHELGHCVPLKAPHIQCFMEFFQEMLQQRSHMPITDNRAAASAAQTVASNITTVAPPPPPPAPSPVPRESKRTPACEYSYCATDEVAMLQCEEIEVLTAMYPAEFTLTKQHSTMTAEPFPPTKMGDLCAAYHILLVLDVDQFDPQVQSLLPTQWVDNIGLQFTLPSNYPVSEVATVNVTTGKLSMHDGFSGSKVQALEEHMREAMVVGDACALLCIQAATEWFYGGMWNNTAPNKNTTTADAVDAVTYVAGIGGGSDNSLSEKAFEEVVDEGVESEHIRLATAEAFAAGYTASIASHSQIQEAEKKVKDKDRDAAALLPPSARGVWNYTVGLVGKPSAGKSTFYNAVTRASLERGGRLMAEVAPHPFTTIEPNIGPGWYASFEQESFYATTSATPALPAAATANPSREDSLEQHRRYPLHGRAPCGFGATSISEVAGGAINAQAGRRLLPVIVKDVAGLVPGAYKGRGKGNRFLADLCDADVLVHVVDITGQADRDGNAIAAMEVDGSVVGASEDKGSSPMEDAEWIREELHRWIYGNVRAKWNSVLACTRGAHKAQAAAKCPATQQQRERTAQRVLALFTGYQGPKWNVELAAHRAGLQLTHASDWQAQDLHRMVAHFLSIRFPVCLALNKIDSLGRSAEQQSIIQHCVDTARLRGEAAVPVSARAECWLLNQQAAALSAEPAKETKTSAAEAATYTEVMSRYRTTGVLEAISAAVALKPPVLCYPVCDLESELPVGWTASKGTSVGDGPIAGHAALPRLQDCLQFKPGSTVGDVFEALKRGALSSSAAVVHGEFVRADGRPLAGTKVTQLRKDSVLDASIALLRVQTNRKSVWQGGAAPVVS